jgi:hypothetical protein
MYLETDIFNHIDHIAAEGANDGCQNCHTNPNLAKNRETSTRCAECHKLMKVTDSFIKVDHNWKGIASGYMQAMHGLCLKCHEQKEKEAGKTRRMGISSCRTCHKEDGTKLYALTKPKLHGRENK